MNWWSISSPVHLSQWSGPFWILQWPGRQQRQKSDKKLPRFQKIALWYSETCGSTGTEGHNFDNSLIGVIYDKFGEDTKVIRQSSGTCIATVRIQVSPTFWGWFYSNSAGREKKFFHSPPYWSRSASCSRFSSHKHQMLFQILSGGSSESFFRFFMLSGFSA